MLNTIAITPKSEDKYVEKVFNSTEFHFSEVTSFKIGTLISILKIRFYGKDNVGVTDRFIFTGDKVIIKRILVTRLEFFYFANYFAIL